MTPYHHPSEFSVTVRTADAHSLRVAIHGDLDYDSSDQFTHAVDEALHAHAGKHGPRLRDLHLDWAEVTAFDSSGLSVLLGLRRRTHAAGIHLHLHHQPDFMVRMLHLTGIADHLTQRPRTADESPSAAATGDAGPAPVS